MNGTSSWVRPHWLSKVAESLMAMPSRKWTSFTNRLRLDPNQVGGCFKLEAVPLYFHQDRGKIKVSSMAH